jgi:UDP-glucose 4-epimerase
MACSRVLVTGGAGFTGSRLCSCLAALGHEVVSIDRRTSPVAARPLNSPVRLIAGDIRDAPALARCLEDHQPEIVFHLAAIHFIPRCTAQPRACIGANVDGTQAVLDVCAETPSVRAVIVASSAAVYAPESTPHGEGGALRPTDIYGHTKLWTEHLAHLFHMQTGKGVGIARLFNVFGPGETNAHLIPTIIEQVREGNVLRLGNLSTVRDYLYLDDAVDGLIRLAAACHDGSVLTCNFGSERPVDGWSLVRIIQMMSGTALAIEQDVARFRVVDRPVLVSDCTRARTHLGWRAAMSLEAGLVETIRQPWAAAAQRPTGY